MHPFRAFALRTPCVLPFAGPCGLPLVPSLLSYVLGEPHVLPESQGIYKDDDGVGPLRVVVDIKGQSRSV